MKPIFLDSSFFKGLLDPKDDFHAATLVIFSRFEQETAQLLTTNYVVDETLTLLRVRCGLEYTLKLRVLLSETRIIKLIRVTVDDEGAAWEWFEKPWSKLSFTDCVSFVVMKRLGIQKVATFDSHFTQAGFDVIR